MAIDFSLWCDAIFKNGCHLLLFIQNGHRPTFIHNFFESPNWALFEVVLCAIIITNLTFPPKYKEKTLFANRMWLRKIGQISHIPVELKHHNRKKPRKITFIFCHFVYNFGNFMQKNCLKISNFFIINFFYHCCSNFKFK